MNVLVVLTVACLDAGLRSRFEPHSEAWFKTVVKFHQLARGISRRRLRLTRRQWIGEAITGKRSNVPKSGPAQSAVNPQFFGQIKIILKVKARFMAKRLLGFAGVKLGVSAARQKIGRHKIMVYVIDSCFDGMPQVGIPAQLCATGPVLNAAFESEFEILLTSDEGKFIRTVGRSDIQEHFVVQDSVPAQRAHRISPGNARRKSGIRAGETEYVLSKVSRQEELVFVAQMHICFGIQVIEVVPCAFKGGSFQRWFGEYVDVGSPTG